LTLPAAVVLSASSLNLHGLLSYHILFSELPFLIETQTTLTSIVCHFLSRHIMLWPIKHFTCCSACEIASVMLLLFISDYLVGMKYNPNLSELL